MFDPKPMIDEAFADQTMMEPALFDEERPMVPVNVPMPVASEEVVGEGLDVGLTLSQVEQFEQAVTLHQRMIVAMLSMTNETHWVSMGIGKYYLQAPGCEVLAKPLGINYHAPVVRREALKDASGLDFYAYWIEGVIESAMLKHYGWFVGYCDSRDQFFNARSGWTPQTGAGDILKAAMSNWFVNGVTRLLGIRNPDPRLLVSAKLDLGKITGVDFGGTRRTEQGGQETISEAQERRMWGFIKNAKMPNDTFKAYLKESYTLEKSSDIKRKDYEAICQYVQAWKPVAAGGNG